MHKKFEINQTKIKGGCQSGRTVVTHNSKSDLPLVTLLKNSACLLTFFYQRVGNWEGFFLVDKSEKKLLFTTY